MNLLSALPPELWQNVYQNLDTSARIAMDSTDKSIGPC